MSSRRGIHRATESGCTAANNDRNPTAREHRAKPREPVRGSSTGGTHGALIERADELHGRS
jgi:hypothetical protein